MTKKRNIKAFIIIGVALVFAAIAAIGLGNILTPQRTTVYIFSADYTAGTQISKGMLTPIQVDSNVIQTGTTNRTDAYYVTAASYDSVISSGGVLRYDVAKDTALMLSMLTSTSGNSVEQHMKSDAIAISVPANNITGVTAELGYGSRVNVYCTFMDTTKLLLENMRILRVAKTEGAISSITLETTQEEALRLVWAQENGSLYFGVVDATGYQYNDGQDKVDAAQMNS